MKLKTMPDQSTDKIKFDPAVVKEVYEDIVGEFQETISCHLTSEPLDEQERVISEAFYVCLVRAIVKERNFYQVQADKCNRLLELMDAEKLQGIIDFNEH